jgi:hypothetical protein
LFSDRAGLFFYGEKKFFLLGIFFIPSLKAYVPSPETYISRFGTCISRAGTPFSPRRKNFLSGDKNKSFPYYHF